MQNYLEENFDINDPEIISAFDELCLWSAPFGQKILSVIKLKRNAKILDVGCGTGFPLLEIAQRFGTSSKAYGIDPWVGAIERIYRKIDAMKLSNVEVIEGVAEEMPFEKNFFDLIVSNNGLNNVQDIAKSLSECYRVAKPDCQFVFTANLPDTMLDFYKVFELVLQNNGLKSEVVKLKEHISHKRKTVQENITFVRESGFKINNIYTDVFRYRFIDGSSFLNYYFTKLAFLESWEKIVPEDRREEVFEEIEDGLNYIAELQGELSLDVPFACYDCLK